MTDPIVEHIVRAQQRILHRRRLHDPRNSEAEPCCPECCTCTFWQAAFDSEGEFLLGDCGGRER